MNRRFQGLVATLALAGLSPFLGATVASAACPNEAFRTGPSAQLPECRAYEQVTPVDKESGIAVSPNTGSYTGTSDDGVYFHSPSAYAGQEGSLIYNPYLALRGSSSWLTRGIGGLQTAGSAPLNSTTLAVSPDLSESIVPSTEALAPGAISEGSNLYLRDNRTGAYTLIRVDPGVEKFENYASSSTGLPFVGGAADWNTILFDFGDGLYEFREGQTRRVATGLAPYGSRAEAIPNIMSADGTSFYYYESEHLYLYRDGRPPLLVSEDEEGNPVQVNQGTLLGATPDGSIAFFTSAEGSLFRFELSAPAGERITEITPTAPGGEQPRIRGAVVGEDGTHVYFAAQGLLTPDAEPRAESFTGYDLYAWQGRPGQPGQIRYLGKSELNGDFQAAQASPNGRYFAIQAAGELTPNALGGCPASSPPGGRCANVFVYSADADTFVCATCTGSAPVGDSHLGGLPRVEGANVAKAVLDDGTVLFDTPNALLPTDSNGAEDVYSYRDGQLRAISTGTATGPSNFIDASADGSNIYFSTGQSLVGQDVDRAVDLYDARVGGGLPQGGPPAPVSCIVGGDCRSGVTSAAAPEAAPSGKLGGSGEGAVACGPAAAKAAKARKRSRALRQRAVRASGRRATSLRKAATREAKAAGRLARKAGDCKGGGR